MNHIDALRFAIGLHNVISLYYLLLVWNRMSMIGHKKKQTKINANRNWYLIVWLIKHHCKKKMIYVQVFFFETAPKINIEIVYLVGNVNFQFFHLAFCIFWVPELGHVIYIYIYLHQYCIYHPFVFISTAALYTDFPKKKCWFFNINPFLWHQKKIDRNYFEPIFSDQNHESFDIFYIGIVIAWHFTPYFILYDFKLKHGNKLLVSPCQMSIVFRIKCK